MTIIIELLLLGTFVALAIRKLNFPSTVALVLVGLTSALPQSVDVDLASDVILALAIPPLVFEAAHRINLGELRHHVSRVLVMAFPGVILTTLLVGGMLTLLTPLAMPMACVFGALISTADPFAVGALLRNLGFSNRLTVLMNGESLLNNVTAIVVFNLAISSVLIGQFQILGSLVEFTRDLVGGVAVGLILGWLISRLVEWGNDDLMETTLTTLLAFGSYLVAERLQFSGVLAVIAAGLINGNLRPNGTINRLWGFLAFLANSVIFLITGLQVNVLNRSDLWQPMLWAIFAVFVARVLVLYGLNGLMQSITDRIPINWLHAWNWAGLRGAIALALVISLPPEFNEYRELMQSMVFGIVLFALVVQSTTMQAFLSWLGLIGQPLKSNEEGVSS
jgi:CPA1 family monovalent cation:H+ antiporter